MTEPTLVTRLRGLALSWDRSTTRLSPSYCISGDGFRLSSFYVLKGYAPGTALANKRRQLNCIHVKLGLQGPKLTGSEWASYLFDFGWWLTQSETSPQLGHNSGMGTDQASSPSFETWEELWVSMPNLFPIYTVHVIFALWNFSPPGHRPFPLFPRPCPMVLAWTLLTSIYILTWGMIKPQRYF